MKRFGRAVLGIPIGIISGFALLFVINGIFSRISSSVGVGELFVEAFHGNSLGDKVFAWALIYGLFAAPIIRGIAEGWREDYSIAGHALLPFVIGVIAVFMMFLIAYVISFIAAFINLIFANTDSFVGLVTAIALFIAFTAPATKVILIIFD